MPTCGVDSSTRRVSRVLHPRMDCKPNLPSSPDLRHLRHKSFGLHEQIRKQQKQVNLPLVFPHSVSCIEYLLYIVRRNGWQETLEWRRCQVRPRGSAPRPRLRRRQYPPPSGPGDWAIPFIRRSQVKTQAWDPKVSGCCPHGTRGRPARRDQESPSSWYRQRGP